jgi:phage terminase small subunit
MINPRYKRFAFEYLKGEHSAAECARRAGYAPKHARSTAYKILHNPEVQKILEYYCSSLEMNAIQCAIKSMNTAIAVMDKPNLPLRDLLHIVKFCFYIMDKSKQYENWR